MTIQFKLLTNHLASSLLESDTGLSSEKVEELIESFADTKIDYKKFLTDPLETQAYPNNDHYMHIPGQHNTQKWLSAVRDIYYKEKQGMDRVQSVRQATSGWNLMETHDFLNWLKFYEEGAHLKYKMAQVWYENGAPGYFLHVKPDPVKEPTQVNNADFGKESESDQTSSTEKKQIIEKQRAKIIGRLDSAEKLLRSNEGQLFAGKELESLMEAIFNLKKKIQLVNKLSVATRIYEDMIVREANIMGRRGFAKAANVLYSVADGGAMPAAASPAPPAEGSGAAGGLPAMGPGMAQTPPDSAPAGEVPLEVVEESKGLQEFLNNTQTANVTDIDQQIAEDDELEVEDDVLQVVDTDELVIKEAQAVPPIDEPMTSSPAPAPQNPTPAFTPAEDIKDKPKTLEDTEKQLEVSEDDIPSKGEEVTPISSNFDAKMDELFANVTIADIVAELESLSKVFKTREIPRRLSRADMMLDSLGLATFFPSLSEAQNKSLEANNYIATRVDDILSKLRGSMAAKKIDLQGESAAPTSPELEGVKNTLKSQDEKEKARKQMRKDQEAGELEGKTKETPDVELKEDLAPAIPAGPAAATPPPAKPRPPAV